MKKIRRLVVGVGVCFIGLFILSACNKESTNNKVVHIYQVSNNGTLQNKADYNLVDGKLTIDKEFQLANNINQLPKNLKDDEKIKETETYLKKEFPKESFDEGELIQNFTRIIKSVEVIVDTDKKVTELKGDSYSYKFYWVDDNEKRVKDDLGVEYAVEYDKK